MTCSRDDLYREMAFVAYHFHWSFEELLDLEHGVRRGFIGEINTLNAAAGR